MILPGKCPSNPLSCPHYGHSHLSLVSPFPNSKSLQFVYHSIVSLTGEDLIPPPTCSSDAGQAHILMTKNFRGEGTDLQHFRVLQLASWQSWNSGTNLSDLQLFVPSRYSPQCLMRNLAAHHPHLQLLVSLLMGMYTFKNCPHPLPHISTHVNL